MSELRIAVVGAGWMGETHLRSYANLPDVRIVGLATRTPARAAELSRQFPIEATFSDAREMIDATKPDGVSICTREDEHVLPTTYALEHGVGVLLEKPIASCVMDAETIAARAGATGTLLVPAHVLRFALPYRTLRQEVASGRIGKVVGISARRDRNQAIANHYGHVHPAYLTSVHDIDLLLWVTGSKVTTVRALEHRSPGRRQPDLVSALLTLESGAVATLSTAYLHPAGGSVATSDRFEVFGSAGVAAVDLTTPLLSFNTSPPFVSDWLLEPPDGTGAFGTEIAHFCECLRGQRPSDVVTVAEAVEGIRIADAIARSADSDGDRILL